VQYPIEAGLEVALRGEVYTELSSLNREEHEFEREIASELIETYAPVRAFNSDQIIAVSEFYQSADELRSDIRAAQVNSWLVVASVMLTVYLLLAGIVRRASKTIEKQQLALQQHVDQLNLLLAQNSELHERSQRAAAHSTDLNERYLRRISADLHDGPAQDLALALLHMDALETAQQNGSTGNSSANGDQTADIEIVRGSVRTALNELRNISAGLRMPHLRHASAEETVRRAVRDYEHKSGCEVDLSIRDVPNQAPMSTKIALYRVVKEALNNGYFHADGKEQAVRVSAVEKQLYVEIEDHGPGFDPTAVTPDKHLGLISMAERVEMLGGQFTVDSVIGRGTIVKARLPMVPVGDYSE
jgi:signal transduction histidine kinase